MYYPCYPGLGRTLEYSYVMLSLLSLGLTMGIGYIFVEFVSLGDPSRRMLMMVRECMSTCYVLFSDCGSAC
jgi:hypothetical protein